MKESRRAALADDEALARAGTPDGAASLETMFTSAEIERLHAARRQVDARTATIVYCVYENPFARGGGIFAVAENYAARLVEAGRDLIVLSPLHSGLKTTPPPGEVEEIASCEVPFGGDCIAVRLLAHRRRGARWLLLQADGMFDARGGEGGTDPYVHADPGGLLNASLFASAAVPHALAALGERCNLILHAQDWELAGTALTTKLAILDGLLESAAVVLTSHNPYDHALTPAALRLLTDRTSSGPTRPHTVYQQMIGLTDAPLTTVSEGFARELTAAPLQTGYFADHLQGVFAAHGVIGVNNGLFGAPNPAYSDAAVEEATAGHPDLILEEKRAKRRTMLAALGDYQDPRILGGLTGGAGGRPIEELPDEIPVFLMFGRLDPGQKGFDLLARAIEQLPRGEARFVLTPIAAGAPQPYREDLAALAAKRPGEVAIYPFRMEHGYLETMAGATYAIMPSIYEPFGGATEPYLVGTPVVARATGGLIQQVIDLDQDPARATGILFREVLAEGLDPGPQWRRIERAASPAARQRVPIYQQMVAALVGALGRADRTYRHAPEVYGHMLANLFDQATTFSWDKTLRGYQKIYDQATR